MPGPYGLKLHPEFQRVTRPGVDDVFRMRVTADSAQNMPAEIFVYDVRPAHPADNGPVADFSHVASPTELETYSTAPLDEVVPLYFRAATIDLLCESREQAEVLWGRLAARVADLIHALERTDDLEALPELVLGDPADP
jgi:hypothetical protein